VRDDAKILLDAAAGDIENAVKSVLEKGYRTADIHQEGTKKVGCREMGELIALELRG